MTIEEALDYIRKHYDELDGCGSCGWKSALYEHEPLEVEQSDIDRGYVRLPCHSEDASENGGHRGMRIYFPTPGKPVDGGKHLVDETGHAPTFNEAIARRTRERLDSE